MKNNKGFMFVEIIVMSMILMIGLLVIYKTFTSSFAVQKSKQYYNMVADDYKLYYLIRYIDETNKSKGGFFSNLRQDGYIQYNGLVNSLIGNDLCSSASDACTTLGISKAYLVKDKDSNRFVLPSSETDEEFKNYFKLSQNCTLKKETGGNFDDNLCIVGKFDNRNTIGKTTYSSISYPFSINNLEGEESE